MQVAPAATRRLTRIVDWLQYVAGPVSAVSYVGWTGHLNLGDEILFEAARECFKPTPIVSDPLLGRPMFKRMTDRKRHLVAILGGGTLIGDHPPFERFKTELKKAGGNGLVFGAGVSQYVLAGSVPTWLEQWGELLRPLHYVGVRGPDSATTLARVGVDAEILGDPVCWFSQPQDFWVPRANVLGLNVGQAQGAMFGDETTVQQGFSDYARAMRQQGWAVEFFCVWPDDLATTRKVAADAGIERPIIHCHYQGARAYLNRVRNLKLFVGIKLHAVALAMCANVPALMVEYRPKCLEFMNTLGMGRFVRRSDQMSLPDLIALTATLDAEGAAISVSIRAAMRPIQGRLHALHLPGALRR